MFIRFLRSGGFLVVLLLGCLRLASAAGETVAPGGALQLLGNVDTLVDPSGQMTVQQVAGASRELWGRSKAQTQHPVWVDRAIWYRVLVSSTPGRPYAVEWPPDVSRVDLYWSAPDGRFEHLAGGYDLQDRGIGQHLLIVPERALGRVWYVRALTGFDLSSPRIEPLQAALNNDGTLLTLFGGFFFAILLVNLILYFVMRERPLLYYAAVMVMLLGLLASDDELWRFVPSTELIRVVVHDVFGWLYFAGTAIWAREFLRLKERDRLLDRWVLILSVASAAGIPADVFGVPRWAELISQGILIALLLSVVVAGIRSARIGFRPARFLVAGSIGVTIGTLVNLASGGWGLPLGPYATYLFEISIAWEALLLTAALADRMNDLYRQNADLQVSRAELARLATRDQLTGVANRRAFDERLNEEWHRAQRNGTAVGLIMLDVDHFKRFNDAFGHVAGDACLSRIALACATTLKRSSDFFARYGGEEFAAIIVTPFEPDVDFVAERMRQAVEAEQIVHPASETGFATISLGAAKAHPAPGESPGTLIASADAALYAAKSGGRNRVSTAQTVKG